MAPVLTLLMVLVGFVCAMVGLVWLFGPWPMVGGGILLAGAGAFLMPVRPAPTLPPMPPFDETEIHP